MLKIKLFTNIAPHYRSVLWRALLKDLRTDFHIFHGNNKTIGIRPIDFEQPEFLPHKKQLHQIENIYFRKILVWQRGVIKECLTSKFDYAIFLSQMYCVSTWIAVIICRIRNIKVVFWGHGIYDNERKTKLFIRLTFLKLAHRYFVYERRAKKLLTNYGFLPDNIYVVFNSLDYHTHRDLQKRFLNNQKGEVFEFFDDPNLPVLIFIGRLTPVKKLDMLLEAVLQINSMKLVVNLVIIGDGSEMDRLREQGNKGLREGWLHFSGACYNEEEIGRYLSCADLCLSPGNVGLTAIHSLSYGTPVGTHGNLKNQMPEAEAIEDGVNGFFFEEDNIEDLIEKIKSWFDLNTERSLVRARCVKIIDQYYNSVYQLTVFNRLINNDKPEI